MPKGCPALGAPPEIWRLACQVDSCQDRAGIGNKKISVDVSATLCLLAQVQVKIRQDEQVPLQWNTSQAFSLYKKNPSVTKTPFEAQRTIHSLEPYGKCFFRHVLGECKVPLARSWEYGYVEGRRREGAILQQNALHAKLNAERISHVCVI